MKDNEATQYNNGIT